MTCASHCPILPPFSLLRTCPTPHQGPPGLMSLQPTAPPHPAPSEPPPSPQVKRRMSPAVLHPLPNLPASIVSTPALWSPGKRGRRWGGRAVGEGGQAVGYNPSSRRPLGWGFGNSAQLGACLRPELLENCLSGLQTWGGAKF